MRGGRQEVQYASSRLVSIREGPNVRLAFDGVRLMQRLSAMAGGRLRARARARCARASSMTGPSRDNGSGASMPPAPCFAWLGLDLYYLGRLRERRRSSKERRASCATRSGHASGERRAEAARDEEEPQRRGGQPNGRPVDGSKLRGDLRDPWKEFVRVTADAEHPRELRRRSAASAIPLM